MEIFEATTRALILKKLSKNQNLLAVSKLQSQEKITELYAAGQNHFAENYIQEALVKINDLKDLSITWHLIGPVQSNKVKFLQKNFAYIHSVDSYKLAEKISANAALGNFVQKIFIQINLSGEVTKSGFTEETFHQHWPKLQKLAGLQIIGLMTMPPLENEPEKNRSYFKKLKYIGNKLNITEYSMGTSHDYQIALEEGATWIRLGTILFGERTQKRDQI